MFTTAFLVVLQTSIASSIETIEWESEEEDNWMTDEEEEEVLLWQKL